ncbi:unnamed protein product [Closterium sp. NIES-53]
MGEYRDWVVWNKVSLFPSCTHAAAWCSPHSYFLFLLPPCLHACACSSSHSHCCPLFLFACPLPHPSQRSAIAQCIEGCSRATRGSRRAAEQGAGRHQKGEQEGSRTGSRRAAEGGAGGQQKREQEGSRRGSRRAAEREAGGQQEGEQEGSRRESRRAAEGRAGGQQKGEQEGSTRGSWRAAEGAPTELRLSLSKSKCSTLKVSPATSCFLFPSALNLPFASSQSAASASAADALPASFRPFNCSLSPSPSLRPGYLAERDGTVGEGRHGGPMPAGAAEEAAWGSTGA